MLFALTGLVTWTYFATAVLGATTSLITNSELVTKVYVPRLAIPLAPLLGALADLTIGLALLGAFLVAFHVAPRAESVVLVPLLLVLLVTTAAGFGYWLSALTARFRDVKHVTPMLLQMMMYASPVVYPLSLIPARYRLAYALNPMVGVIEGLRSVVLRTPLVDARIFAVSCAVSAVLLVSGVLFFRRTERLFADIV
jgi:lipopolysaccharide transport system permease protein